MSGTDFRTLAFYDENASAYSARKPRCEDIKALEFFMDELPNGSSICDLGCGNGWASASLVKNGHLVRAIDGAAGLAVEAKRMYGLDVEVASFDKFTFQNEFDGLWACWSLHHTPREAFPTLLAQVSKAVRSGGLLFFSVKGGPHEGRDKNDRLYAYYEWEELSKIIDSSINGTIIKHTSWTVEGSDGEASIRHQVFVRIAP